MPMVPSAEVPTGSSLFGAVRRNKDGSERTHNGVDLYADRGDPVLSPGAGTVMHANNGWTKGFGGYGRVVVVALDSGGEVLAGHLDRVVVSAGQRVERGEKIGTVGDTSFSDDNPTGRFLESEPHTHVEFLTGASYPVRREVVRQDPMPQAFFDMSVPEPDALPAPTPKPAEPEAFATLQDAQDRADALLNRWNNLIAQSSGPSSRGRADIPAELQNAIIADRARFRDFITSPMFGTWGMWTPRMLDAFASTDYDTLTRWHETYEKRAQQVANALPRGEALASNAIPVDLPRQTTATENLERLANTTSAIVFGVGVLAALGLGAFAFSRSRR